MAFCRPPGYDAHPVIPIFWGFPVDLEIRGGDGVSQVFLFGLKVLADFSYF